MAGGAPLTPSGGRPDPLQPVRPAHGRTRGPRPSRIPLPPRHTTGHRWQLSHVTNVYVREYHILAALPACPTELERQVTGRGPVVFRLAGGAVEAAA